MEQNNERSKKVVPYQYYGRNPSYQVPPTFHHQVPQHQGQPYYVYQSLTPPYQGNFQPQFYPPPPPFYHSQRSYGVPPNYPVGKSFSPVNNVARPQLQPIVTSNLGNRTISNRKRKREPVVNDEGNTGNLSKEVKLPLRKKRKVEIIPKLSADQTFQMFTQMMCLGYFEKNLPLPSHLMMAVHHFEILRKARVMGLEKNKREEYFSNILESISNATGVSVEDLKKDNMERMKGDKSE